MAKCDTSSVVAWLVDGARSARSSELVLEEMCTRLCACGMPLWRVEVFVRTLHPEVVGRRFRWQQGDEVSVSTTTFDLPLEHGQSFIEHLCAQRIPIHTHPGADDRWLDFPRIQELWAEGVTDLLAAPLIFTEGDAHAAIFTTREVSGFSEEQIAGLEALINPLARIAEVRALQRTATNLLDTYVGHGAGERILSGQIRRGHTESIHAAIWLSDMRGFTTLSDHVPPPAMIGILNQYFDCQVPNILRHGGEVLNFMGDGLLAMFPIENPSDERRMCRAALAAGLEARARIAELRPSDVDGVKKIRFGLALHMGDVLFGNIGGGNRLDFTCIGPAVNLAARLEKIAAELGRTIVTSSAFAQHFDTELTALGDFAVRGFGARQQVFGLIDEA
ncbi:MAG TPA: adenylate/guanylate cyclase domain-containing protein [Pyrinomonadaceae bacterium]|nr:adenylate/guanylate cyclase domain-containing protein [Pyrinomonadaceae bacterium]